MELVPILETLLFEKQTIRTLTAENKRLDAALRELQELADYIPCTQWDEKAECYMWISEQHQALYDAGVKMRLARRAVEPEVATEEE